MLNPGVQTWIDRLTSLEKIPRCAVNPAIHTTNLNAEPHRIIYIYI